MAVRMDVAAGIVVVVAGVVGIVVEKDGIDGRRRGERWKESLAWLWMNEDFHIYL